VAQRSTTVDVTQVHHVFNVDRNIYGTYHTTEKALKLQLLEAVQHIYIEDLHNKDISFSKITTCQIIAHIWSTYGDIDDDMLGDNTERMKSPW